MYYNDLLVTIYSQFTECKVRKWGLFNNDNLTGIEERHQDFLKLNIYTV